MILNMEIIKLILNSVFSYKDFVMSLIIYCGFGLLLYAIKLILLKGLKKIVDRSKTSKDDVLWDKKVPHKLLNYFCLLTLIGFLPVFFPKINDLELVYRLLNSAYIILHVTMLLIIVDWLNMALQQKQSLKKFPINNFLQSVKLVLMGIATLLVIATFLNQSVVALVSGIGALAALLSFIFKDLLLSLVASIQIAVFDLIRVDDWIEMPSHNADGDVLDISLTTIRIQNWDKTIVAIPTNAILTTPFKNWRGMSSSGARRMKKHILLDVTSIRLCDHQFIESLKMNQSVDQLALEEALKYLETQHKPYTNSALLRFYMEYYLKVHQKTNERYTMMLRFLESGSQGLPLEVYCFFNNTEWVDYEHFQAEIIEYLMAVLPFFNLKPFQFPTGDQLKTFLP